jgi:homopolymeric O-antigen transport system ATP-binding protein
VCHGADYARQQPVSGAQGDNGMSKDNQPAIRTPNELADGNVPKLPDDMAVALDEPVAVERLAMLELDNVSHSYHTGRKSFDHGTHHVLNEVSLQLYDGETLGIIGRNGVGKTTLLRLMAGILGPTHGKVRIHPGKSASLLTLGLGFKPELSGRDNAYLSALLQGSSRKQAKSFLESIKDFSELGESFNQPVKDYSSGMRSRLAFTTALMTHVDILLIDEILSVGDAHFREKALDAMKSRIMGEQTVVFVSHMAEQVKSLCDRVVWLEEGKVMAIGPADEVTDAYSKSVQEARIAAREKQVVASA